MTVKGRFFDAFLRYVRQNASLTPGTAVKVHPVTHCASLSCKPCDTLGLESKVPG